MKQLNKIFLISILLSSFLTAIEVIDFKQFKVSDFKNKIKLKSDKDLDESSATSLSADKKPAGKLILNMSLAKNENLGEQYIDVQFPVTNEKLKNFSTLKLYLSVDRPLAQFYVYVVNMSGTKEETFMYKLDEKLASGQQVISIPLSDFTVRQGITKGKMLVADTITGIGFRVEGTGKCTVTLDRAEAAGKRETAPAASKEDINQTISAYDNAFWIAHFDDGRDPLAGGGQSGVYSDKDESQASKTTVKGAYYNLDQRNVWGGKGFSYMIAFDVHANPTLTYQYASAAFTIPEGKDITMYDHFVIALKGDYQKAMILLEERIRGKKLRYQVKLAGYHKSGWQELKIPLKSFKTKFGDPLGGDKISVISVVVDKPASGKIYIDNIAFIAEGTGRGGFSSRRLSISPSYIAKYETTPETGHKMTHSLKLDVKSKIKDVILEGQLSYDTRDFGKAKYIEDYEDNRIPTDIIGSGLRINVSGLDSFNKIIHNIQIGAMDINWGEYSIYKLTFYQGARLAGYYKGGNFWEAMYLKRWHTSFLTGGRWLYKTGGFWIMGKHLWNHKTGFLPENEDDDNVTADTVQNQYLNCINVTKNFFGPTLKVKTYAGILWDEHYFNNLDVGQNGEIYGEKLARTRKLWDWAVKADADLKISVLKFSTEYKWIGPYYNFETRDKRDDDRGYIGLTGLSSKLSLPLVTKYLKLTGSFSFNNQANSEITNNENGVPVSEAYIPTLFSKDNRMISWASVLEFNNFEGIKLGFEFSQRFITDDQKRVDRDEWNYGFYSVLKLDRFEVFAKGKFRYADIRTGELFDDEKLTEEEADIGRHDGWQVSHLYATLKYNILPDHISFFLEYMLTTPDGYFFYYNSDKWDNFFRAKLKFTF
ncbi:MAG TPA: hypothetical protein VKS21_00610 [Spirochaetota bacterium]|nr:hypothetical protein [Spirochaetota bacterium]